MQYFLKSIKLIIVISNCTFFVGILWFIFCEGELDFNFKFQTQDDGSFTIQDPDLGLLYSYDELDLFQPYFGINGSSPREILTVCVYYAFTSLSTVGFGDYHPRTNSERIFCTIILLFGVIIFTLVMDNFAYVLHSFRGIRRDFEDSENLTKFFGTIKKFNN